MHFRQWLVVVVTLGLNALDGFDVLSISFASPGIARDWGIDRATLGWILSMELVGMALGSLILGGIVDKAGRRPMILICLAAMSLGMVGAEHASTVSTLLAWRLLTGFGIGGMLTAVTATAAEVSNRRWRTFAMSLMVIGYPLGGILGGLAVQHLLGSGSWRDVFQLGAWATALFIPIVFVCVPESVAYLSARGTAALPRVNTVLSAFGHAPVTKIAAPVARSKASLIDIFKPDLALSTLLVTFAYFAHIVSFYFILKWIPKIVVDMGFSAKAAAGVLTWSNVGGAIGCALFGLAGTKLNVRILTLLALMGSSAMIVWFGRGAADIVALSGVVAVAGIFTNSAVSGLYSLFATVFPPHVRATGTGFAIGIGRGGSALAPVVAGYLFQAGFSLQAVAVFMGLGSVLAATALLMLRNRGTSRH